ncbi:unnamed protein product [Durusdinium trenchii]|uniref:Uncharacterized protein n=1 Tax=Durusdinium trenchii TaxID=1381693 RepID=A0ABP0S3B4_9DINO
MRSCVTRAAFAKDEGLFKAAKAWQVLSNLLASPSHFDLELYDSLPSVEGTDTFISHSWSCPAWMKYLGICYYLNLDLAVEASTLACVLAVSMLLFRSSGSITVVAQEGQFLLMGALILFPVAMFLLIFFFGQFFCQQSFWFDRICVNQAHSAEKAKTLQGIPAFVAHSQQMLVLLDSTYFERLWCNYEVAIAAKTFRNIQLVPVWEPVFTLGLFAIGLFGALSYFGAPEEPRIDADGDLRSSLFQSVVIYYYVPWYICLCLALPTAWLSSQKLAHHKLMLKQITSFELRAASCALASDREIIEEQIMELFDEAFEPPVSVSFQESSFDDGGQASQVVSPESMRLIRHVTSYPSKEEVMQEFNAYIRGPLHLKLLSLLGSEVDVPLKLCVIGTAPSILLCLTLLLGCNGHHDCDTAAARLGYPSVTQYMLVNVLVAILSPLYMVILLPLTLRGTEQVAKVLSHRLEILCSTLLVALLLYLLDLVIGAWAGSFAVVVIDFNLFWLMGFMASSLILGFLVWHLHFARRP